MAQRKREHHPGSDPDHQQDAREPTNAGERNAVAAGANVGGEFAQHSHRQPDGGEEPDKQEVVAGGRQRVHVLLRDEEHDHQRNHERTEIRFPLAPLAKHNKKERRIDEVIGSSHAAMIGRGARPVVGAGVEPPVDLGPNLRV